MKNRIILITGGARSGKSSFALKEASGIAGKKAFIATAEALDVEMKERIESHKRQRGKDWDTFEEPLRISEAIRGLGGKYRVIVLDCLTLWVSNLMLAKLDFDSESENLISALKGSGPGSRHRALLYIISNEVGMGIVPVDEMTRRFRDLSGILNQKVAEVSDEVYLVTSGIPVKIKGDS
jgi:adenosylcobinamide kinase/adenosylcobinamide-phosphate guanylyltransferase